MDIKNKAKRYVSIEKGMIRKDFWIFPVECGVVLRKLGPRWNFELHSDPGCLFPVDAQYSSRSSALAQLQISS